MYCFQVSASLHQSINSGSCVFFGDGPCLWTDKAHGVAAVAAEKERLERQAAQEAMGAAEVGGALKAKYPQAIVCTDIALDPYSSMGHDGVIIDGKIANDVTIAQLCKH